LAQGAAKLAAAAEKAVVEELDRSAAPGASGSSDQPAPPEDVKATVGPPAESACLARRPRRSRARS